jgi:hypothetical protein
MNERTKILQEGIDLINSDRAAAYGDWAENMQRTANILNGMQPGMATPGSICITMVAVKLARILHNSEHRDSYVDACVYLAGIYECIAAQRALMDAQIDEKTQQVIDELKKSPREKVE